MDNNRLWKKIILPEKRLVQQLDASADLQHQQPQELQEQTKLYFFSAKLKSEESLLRPREKTPSSDPSPPSSLLQEEDEPPVTNSSYYQKFVKLVRNVELRLANQISQSDLLGWKKSHRMEPLFSLQKTHLPIKNKEETMEQQQQQQHQQQKVKSISPDEQRVILRRQVGLFQSNKIDSNDQGSFRKAKMQPKTSTIIKGSTAEPSTISKLLQQSPRILEPILEELLETGQIKTCLYDQSKEKDILPSLIRKQTTKKSLKSVASTYDKKVVKTQPKVDNAMLSNMSYTPTPKWLLFNGYRYIDLIDEGAFGKIYRGKHIQTDQIVAIKEIDRQHPTIKSWLESGCMEKEMKIMLAIRHPNLVYAYDVMKFRKIAFIIMPFVDGGNLRSIMFERCQPFDERTSKKYFYDMAKGIYYLHHNDIVHRDLKLENLLLDKPNNRILIADFGFATILSMQQEKYHKYLPKKADQLKSKMKSEIPIDSNIQKRTTHGAHSTLKTNKMICFSPCGTVEYSAPEINMVRMEIYVNQPISDSKKKDNNDNDNSNANNSSNNPNNPNNYITTTSEDNLLSNDKLKAPKNQLNDDQWNVEFLKHDIQNGYDAKAGDIYSMGVCLYEILHFFKPFLRSNEYNIKDSMEKIKIIYPRQMTIDLTPNKRVFLTQECVNLIFSLLDPLANRRPNIDQVLSSLWLRKIVDNRKRKHDKIKQIIKLIEEYYVIGEEEKLQELEEDEDPKKNKVCMAIKKIKKDNVHHHSNVHNSINKRVLKTKSTNQLKQQHSQQKISSPPGQQQQRQQNKKSIQSPPPTLKLVSQDNNALSKSG